MRLFKCRHSWEIAERSNVLQLDDMGYPLRLYISKCCKCGQSKQEWIDVSEAEAEELKTGESVLLQWKNI